MMSPIKTVTMRMGYRVQQRLWYWAEQRTHRLLVYAYLDQVPLTCYRRALTADRALGEPHRM